VHKTILAAATGFGLASGWVGAVDAPAEARPGRVTHLEVAVEGDAPPSPSAKVGEAPSVVERDGFRSVQVNVAPAGLNIVGDAANEPSLAVDPTAPNRMAIGWRQFDSISSSFRQAGWAYSRDGGRTWTFPGALDPGKFRSDPILAADGDGDYLYYYSLRGTLRCDLFRSEDGGATWGEAIPAFGGDKAWLVVDRTTGSGRGNVYVSWSVNGNPWGTRVFTRSTDHGATYSDPITLAPAPIWGTPAVGPEGELYLSGNAGNIADLFVVWRSLDARDPAVAPTFEMFLADLGGAQAIGSGPNPGGLLGQVWLAVDQSTGPYRGTLYLLASVAPRDRDDPLDVHLIRSTDRGETWSQPIRVNVDDRAAWQWFATLSVAPNGRLDVVWVESLDGAAANVGELTYVSSSDGGSTWTTPQAVSPSFDSFVGWPNQNKLGDYYHMESDEVGVDLAWAATFNGEQDVYYLRLGSRDCNRNGLADEEDLAAGSAGDCDGNAIPDSCEMAAEAALDIDGNGRLDACEPAPRRPGGRLGG
jgi:hypothetical protein